MESVTDTYYGIGFVMILDAVTFLVSLWTLYLMPKIAPASQHKDYTFMEMLLEGFSSVLKNKGLRYLLISVACINFSFLGPFLIGIPIMAKNELRGAYSYGLIMSSWGIGALIGYFIAGFTTRPQKNPTTYFLCIVIVMGILFSLFSYASNTYQFVLLSFFAAVSAGYVMLSLLTLIQKNTTPRLMGRTMSIVLFFWIGLNPVSELVAGNLLELLGNDIFKYAGMSILTIATISLFSKNIRTYGNA
jgi:predicted MFS family arabinose efflux permease